MLVVENRCRAGLPACLADPGNLPFKGHQAEHVAAQAELAVIAARTSRQRATIAQANGGGVSRELLQRLGIPFGPILRPERRVLVDQLLALRFTRDQTFT